MTLVVNEILEDEKNHFLADMSIITRINFQTIITKLK